MKKAMELLHHIQSAPEPVKRRWIVVVSAVVVVAVVFLWLKYFNTLLVPAEQVNEGSPTFWETMKTGISVLFAMVKNFFVEVGGVFGTSREFEVVPQ